MSSLALLRGGSYRSLAMGAVFSKFPSLVLLALTVLASASGCASTLGTALVSAPNRFNPLAGKETPWPTLEELSGVDRQFFVPVGPPAARLSVSLVEPDPKKFTQPRGTVLVLHGISARSLVMKRQARELAAGGYRAVLVDLRGHGASSGKWLTYGVQEATDLSQVIDELERRGLVSGSLGVYGVSYGATTALHLAGSDERIRAVVAVAPFSSLRDEVPDYAHTVLPGIGRMIPSATYDKTITAAGRTAGFDPDRSALLAVEQTRAKVLILHGTSDWLVPVEHGERLAAAAPEHVELRLIPNFGHTAVWADPFGDLAHETETWFAEHLQGE